MIIEPHRHQGKHYILSDLDESCIVLTLCLPRESLTNVPQIQSISFFQQQNMKILVRSLSNKNYTFSTITSLGYFKENWQLHTICCSRY